MVLVQKWPFFQLSFLGNIRQENVSYDILQRKNVVLFRLWKQEFKKVEKFRFFPKGLAHDFGPKLAIFPSFYLDNIGQENVFYDILELKNASVGYKNKKFKK